MFLKLAEITWYCRTMTMYYIYTSYPCNKCILLSQRIMSVKWYMYEAIFVLVSHYNPILPDFEIINYLFNYRYGSRSEIIDHNINMKPARPWMLAHLKIIWQFHQKVSRFFRPRYIGDNLFLGPNLVSAVVPLFELSFLTKSQKLASA